MAEWSCSGLQLRLRRFDSDSSLQYISPNVTTHAPQVVGATHGSAAYPGSQTAKCKHCAGCAIRARHAPPLRTRLSAHQFPTPGGAGGESSYHQITIPYGLSRERCLSRLLAHTPDSVFAGTLPLRDFLCFGGALTSEVRPLADSLITARAPCTINPDLVIP